MKGLDILFQAFKMVSEHQKEIELIIVGVDQNNTKLTELAIDLGINDRVHWAGIKDEAWKVMQAADIYVQPSRSEGLPLTVMEAMALKLPIIATSVGGIPEAVLDGDNGYLAKPGDAESLSFAILRILKEPAKWREMGERGYNRYSQLFDGFESANNMLRKYLVD